MTGGPAVRHNVLLNIVARLAAAAINGAALALYTRLAPPAVYGAYVEIFVYAYVVEGLTLQWLSVAYLARYRSAGASQDVTTLCVMAGAGLAGLAAVAGLLAATGILAADTAAAGFAMVATIAVFELAVAVAVARIETGIVATAMLARAIATIALGSAALRLFGTGEALAFAISAGTLIGATVPLYSLNRFRRGGPSGAKARELASFGGPLIAANGITSAAQSSDRMILSYLHGPAVLGPYGAIFDLLKQSFFVLGQGISTIFVPMAKQAQDRGDHGEARRVMGEAFTAMVALGLYACLFILLFQDEIVTVFFGEAYRAAAVRLLPWLLAASVLLYMRSYYFGEVIILGARSWLELGGALLLTAVQVPIAFLLAGPAEGVGAAVAVLAANLAGCIYFAVLGRRSFPLPLPLGALIGIALPAAATGALCAWGVPLLGLGQIARDVVVLALLGASFAAVAFANDIVGLRAILARGSGAKAPDAPDAAPSQMQPGACAAVAARPANVSGEGR